MYPSKVAKRISAKEGMLFGLLLLGQITGILAATAVLGWLADLILGTTPVMLAVGVLAGSIWASITVLRSVRKELTDTMTAEDESQSEDLS